VKKIPLAIADKSVRWDVDINADDLLAERWCGKHSR
jgi:hypothetical protein